MSVQSVTGEDSQKKMQDLRQSSANAAPSLSMNESLSELMKLLEVVEGKIPCNPQSPKNLRHQRAFQRMIARYFQHLETAFPYDYLNLIYYRYVEWL